MTCAPKQDLVSIALFFFFYIHYTHELLCCIELMNLCSPPPPMHYYNNSTTYCMSVDVQAQDSSVSVGELATYL